MNEYCKVEAEPRRCIADYDKETREYLFETKCILIDIYTTITGRGSETKQEDEPMPESMVENAQINKEMAMQIRGMAKAIGMELFGK